MTRWVRRKTVLSSIPRQLAAVLVLLTALAACTVAVAQQASPRESAKQAMDSLGDPLPPGAVARLGTIRFRHANALNTFALSSDGKTLATAAGRMVVLWDAVSGKERCRFARHDRAVTRLHAPVVAFSPDGKTLASGSLDWTWSGEKASASDNTILLHDSGTGKVLRRFLGHQGRAKYWGRDAVTESGVRWLAFTPDGKKLVSHGADETIRVWDVATGKEQRRITNVSGNRAALSRDGKIIAAVVGDIGRGKGEVRLWEIDTAKEVRRLPYTGWNACVAISPDGATLATSSGPKARQEDAYAYPENVVLQDLKTGRTTHTLRGHTQGIFILAFSPDGKTLISSSMDGSLRQWDVTQGKEVGKFGEGQHEVVHAVFSPDGKTLLTRMIVNDLIHTVRFWDVASRKEVRRLGGHQSQIGKLAFSTDGGLLASGSADANVIVWDVPSRTERHYLSAQPGRVIGLGFTANGAQVSSVGVGGGVRSWDTKTGSQVRAFDMKHAMDKTVVAPGGKMLASWQHDRLIYLWDAVAGKELRRLEPKTHYVRDMDFSTDGRLLAVAGRSSNEPLAPRAVTIWDVTTGQRLHQLAVNDNAYSLAFAADGRTLAVGYRSDKVRIWEVTTGGERFSFGCGRLSTILAFSPDGTLLTSGNSSNAYEYTPSPDLDEQKVWLWDPFTGKQLHGLTGHTGPVTSLAFSPDGRLLASGSTETTVLLWDATKLPRVGRPQPVKLTATELQTCWSKLDSRDAAVAYGSMRQLIAAPRQAVDLLRKCLPPVALVEPKRMAKLLGELDGDDYGTREKASNELTKLGASAEPALRTALAGGLSLEARRRIERLLITIEGQHPRIMRAVEVLERLGTEEARKLLERLAGGATGVRLTSEARAALGRLGAVR